jgi:hypothetical protein
MKRLSALLLGALALFVNACEKHPASRLPDEHATEFGKHMNSHGSHGGVHGEHPAPAAADEHAPVAATHAESPKPAAQPTPGEAPKFFPEKK